MGYLEKVKALMKASDSEAKTEIDCAKSVLSAKSPLNSLPLPNDVPPIIWETGNIDQLRSTLVWKEANLVRLKAQLTGDPQIDWWARNHIRNLELHIADIKRWLAESEESQQ